MCSQQIKFCFSICSWSILIDYLVILVDRNLYVVGWSYHFDCLNYKYLSTSINVFTEYIVCKHMNTGETWHAYVMFWFIDFIQMFKWCSRLVYIHQLNWMAHNMFYMNCGMVAIMNWNQVRYLLIYAKLLKILLTAIYCLLVCNASTD